MPSRHFSSVQLDLRERPCADEGISHHAGFNEWAEANDIVIIYPAMTSWGVTGQTKAGCWDGCECLALTSSFSTSLIRGCLRRCADGQRLRAEERRAGQRGPERDPRGRGNVTRPLGPLAVVCRVNGSSRFVANHVTVLAHSVAQTIQVHTGIQTGKPAICISEASYYPGKQLHIVLTAPPHAPSEAASKT